MILALVLFSIVLAAEPAFGHSLGGWGDSSSGFDIEIDSYSGPWNYGNRFWSGGLGGGFGGFGGGYGGWLGGSRGYFPVENIVEDIGYDVGYAVEPGRRIDVGQDRVVRDFAVTETDNYIRDRQTFRTPPRFRSYAVPRRVFSTGYGIPRTSSIRTGGDAFFLRR